MPKEALVWERHVRLHPEWVAVDEAFLPLVVSVEEFRRVESGHQGLIVKGFGWRVAREDGERPERSIIDLFTAVF